MAAIRMEIHGAQELMRRLKTLPDRLAKKVIRQSLRAGAKHFATEAKARVPIHSGALRRSIRVRAGRRSRSIIRFNVQTSESENVFTGQQFYGGMIEYGTSRMAAQPFLRPAFDARREQVIGLIRRDIASGVVREAKRG